MQDGWAPAPFLAHHRRSVLLLLCHLSFCSAGGHAGFLLSQPLLLLARTTKKFSVSISAATQERAAFGKFHLVSEYRSALTRLLALIFLVSTLFSAVIFLMFSWASFNLWKETRKRPARLNIIRQSKRSTQ